MFNVSALMLDDALKPATPINENQLIFDKVKAYKNYAIFGPPCICHWIEQGLTSPPTQYRLSGRQFYRSKDPTNSIKVLTVNLRTTQ